ncbi:hypothetical protein PV797_05895 [Clostridiaceae bacterium M8S5]|nr:hypothetical protein PV797_05895 [Clostridiaceae bacterium M8S5]
MNILLKAIGMFILVIGGVKLTHIINSRYTVNRWILGFTAPLVLIIPKIISKNLNSVVWNILQIIFSLQCIMFFEITREMLEKKKSMSIYKKGK